MWSTRFPSHEKAIACVLSCCWGRLTRDSCPRFLLGSDHIGSPCLAHTSLPDSRKLSRCSLKHIVCTNISDTVYDASHFWNGNSILEIQVCRHWPRANLEIRLFKDSSLGPAMLTIFCTINFVSSSWFVKILPANNNPISNYLCTLMKITRLELLIRSY